jgi:SPASM domain peptide maturase of grasp-with-spasm system
MNIDDCQYIHLLSDCLPVKGAKNSAIYDLSRGNIHSFPTEFFSIFKMMETKTYGSLKKIAVEMNSLEEFTMFIEFLVGHNMIIAIHESERSLFPNINFDTWDKPCLIQNAIIDLKDTKLDFENIFNQLDDLECEYVQVRQYNTHYTLEDLGQLLHCSYNKSILGIEFIIPYDTRVKEKDYQTFVKSHPILYSVTVHGAPENKIVYADLDQQTEGLLRKQISFIEPAIDSSDHCGVITRRSLTSPSTSIVSEFKQFNGCLNRKISIDHNGEIRNCPSLKRSYGNISETTLQDAFSAPDFKECWTDAKDTIETCNICEYRYACSDCRAFTQGSQPLAKPEKCKYDPHTGTWDEENIWSFAV